MIALVTTTIAVPNLLRVYREADPDVLLIVVGDEQTPHREVRQLLNDLQPASYYAPDDQRALGYACVDLLGWRVPARRSIGFLEAAAAGASIIVTIDDDNIPIGPRYFDDFRRILGEPFTGLEAGSESGWVDPGEFLVPPVHHRGFPHELWHPFSGASLAPTSGRRVGVAAGFALGDPDIDAVTRIANAPRCYAASAVGAGGFVTAARCYSPFNSQNTAFVRELLPVLVMLSAVGRYDDIWASYIAERVMREHGLAVHYGPPLVWQERNRHDLVRDLVAEVEGMAKTLRFVDTLENIELGGTSVVDDAAVIFEHLGATEFAQLRDVGVAWVRDAARALNE